MTQGPIQLDPDPDEILQALKKALRDDPGIRERRRGLIEGPGAGGYLREEPDPVLVAEMLGTIEDEGHKEPFL